MAFIDQINNAGLHVEKSAKGPLFWLTALLDSYLWACAFNLAMYDATRRGEPLNAKNIKKIASEADRATKRAV